MRRSLEDHWHPRLEQKPNIYLSTQNAFIARHSLRKLNSFLTPFNKDRKNGKNSTSERDFYAKRLQQDQFPFESIIVFLAWFLSILKTGENGRWTYHRVRGEEKTVKCRWFMKIEFHKTSQKLHWKDADHNDWFSNFSYLFPYSLSLKIKLQQTELRFIQSSI